MSLPFCTSLFSCTLTHRLVRLPAGDSEEKQSSVTLPVLVTLSATIWFTGQRHHIVFRHVMQLLLLVL